MLEIESCRICGSKELATLLDLGTSALTGIFPDADAPDPRQSRLELVQCAGACRLVQLRQCVDADLMYGMSYGYRSSLNASMARHLSEVVRDLQTRVSLASGDTVLDIGSNDGTTLSFYSDEMDRVGIDPTIKKFGHYYKPDITKVADFFSAASFQSVRPNATAKIVTSISMFYDLPDPLAFMKDVASVLDDEGVWFMEQSYLPTMLQRTAYDTICHEHVEYYGLEQIDYLAERAGLVVVDVELNDINGGSFAVWLKKSGAEPAPRVEKQRAAEKAFFESGDVFGDFADRVKKHREAFPTLLRRLKAEGKKVHGYGASTKGNVVLQYCDIGVDLLPKIAEINEDKFGCVTPGTRIPIVSEASSRQEAPDVYVVLPWHFRENTVAREQAFMAEGGQLLFPLPEIELVGSSN